MTVPDGAGASSGEGAPSAAGSRSDAGAPRYGEYASAEEQRARIAQSGGASAEPAHAAQTAPATTRAARPTRSADRVITVALLAYGLFTVVTAIPQLLDFAGFAKTWMQVAGLDAEFTNHAAGVTWGRIGAAVFGAGWLLTAVLSWVSLRARRVSWWIPLLGAIITFLVVSVCMAVPLLGDPAVSDVVGSGG